MKFDHEVSSEMTFQRVTFGAPRMSDFREDLVDVSNSLSTTPLSLDRDSFDRIIEQNPVMARGIYRVLTERLPNTLARSGPADAEVP